MANLSHACPLLTIMARYGSRIGVAGTLAPSPMLMDEVRDQIDAITVKDTVIVTSGRKGVEAIAARHALARGLAVHIIVPIDTRYMAEDWRATCTSYTAMPAGSSFKDQHAEVVRASILLVAFPAAPETHPTQRHSATWRIVRTARAAALPLFVVRRFH